MARRRTIGELAKEYLQSQGLTGVGWGDVGLLHDIAEYAGLPHRSWRTERQVLNALDRSPLFEKWYIRVHVAGRERLVRHFRIKDAALQRARKE